VVTKPFAEKGVSTATTDAKQRAHNLDFKLVETNAGKVEFYYPTVTQFVHISSGIPETF